MKAGVVQDEVYETEPEAKAQLGLSFEEDDLTTPDTDESNYTVEEEGGFKVYTINE